MAISLFPPNNKTYSAASPMLESADKAAIIHPMRTGKSFIGFKLCEDLPDEKIVGFLLLIT